MKRIILLLSIGILSHFSGYLYAQSIGINTSTPDSSASLDVYGTDKGILIPRVSLVDVNNTTSPISNPATSLLVYNTNAGVTGGNGKGFYFFNGSKWEKIAASTISNLLQDTDSDTKVLVEKSPDEDYIRFDVQGNEAMIVDKDGRVLIGADSVGQFFVGMGIPDITDQNYQIGTGTNIRISQHVEGYQTFVAPATGYLYFIGLSWNDYSFNRVITLYDGLGTSGTVLYTSAPRNNYNVGVGNIYVEAGQVLTLHNSDLYSSSSTGNVNNYTNGDLFVNGSNVSSGDLRFYVSIRDTTFLGFEVDAGGVTIGNYTLPLTDGAANQSLVTDGNGTVTWQDNHQVQVPLSYILDNDNDTKIQVEETNDDDHIRFDVVGKEAMVIDDAGNVGIGKSDPQAYLHVATGFAGADLPDQVSMTNDQRYTTTSPFYQSFKPGLYGKLGGFTFISNGIGNRTYNVEIREGQGTSGTLLGSATYNVPSVSGPYDTVYLDLRSLDVFLDNNVVYSIVFVTGGDFRIDGRNPYNRGICTRSSSHDLSFTTHMISPDAGFMVSDNGVTINDYTFPVADGSADQRLTTDGNGNLSWQSYITPTLTLSGDILTFGAGNSVNLSNTDNQTLSLSGSNLTIANGNTVSLSSINTDAQQLSLSGTSLSIGNGNTVNLNAINTLSFSGNNLSISNGNTVNLSSINTDAQQLTLSGNNLSIGNGNTVSLAAFGSTGDWLFSGNHLYNGNSGNVGIGLNNPGEKLHVSSNIKLNGTLMLNSGDAVEKIYLTSSGTNGSKITHTNGWAINYMAGPGNTGTLGGHYFYTTDGGGYDPKFWIVSDGRSSLAGKASGDSEFVMHLYNQSTDGTTSTRYNGLKITAGKTSNNGANSRMIAFYRPGNVEIGKISQDNASSVTYASSSDLRRKTNIVPTAYSLTDLMNIEVRDYEFIAEMGDVKTGFIAQQLYTVYPDAVVVGGEDVDTDPWMVDYGMLTPLLVKAMQDQHNLRKQYNQELEDKIKQQQELIAQQQQLINDLINRLDALDGQTVSPGKQ